MLERLVTICRVFGGSMIKGSETCRGRRRAVYAKRIAVNRFSPIRLVQKQSFLRWRLGAIGAEGANGGHAVDGGSRL